MTAARAWVLAAVMIAGCGGGKPASTSASTPTSTPAQESDAGAAPTCADAPGWRYERIALPPEFAPALPAGMEILWFAPGMFEPASASYFSYVFSLAFDQPADVTEAGVTALLHDYYRGLIGAVARSKQLPFDPASVVASVQATKQLYYAQVALPDTFTTGAPITVHMELAVAPSCLRVAASAHAPDAPVWQDLRRALACVPCP